MNKIGSILAGIALALAGLSPASQAREATPSERVTSAVLVREGPSTDTAILGRLRPGDSAEIVGEVSGWYAVELPDGTRGYVSKAWTVERGADEAPPGFVATRYKLHVIDVGTGLALFVEGKDFALLYDAGSQDDLRRGDDNRVIAYIRAVRPELMRLDHLILSHPHKDHLELMPDIFARFDVKHVWESGTVNETNGYCRFLKAVEAEPGVQYHDATGSGGTRAVRFSGSSCGGDVTVRRAAMMDENPVRLGDGASMVFLHRDPRQYSSNVNRNSVVVRLDLGGKRVLLTGDAEAGDRQAPSNAPRPSSVEGQLLARGAPELKADVLVVGHHGSLTSSRSAFLDAVNAPLYAISSGPFPYHGIQLPDAEIVTELERRGTVFRTDRTDLHRILDEARACESRPRKIGPDADETPGGCDNILMSWSAGGPISAAYSEITD